ncbi:YjzD family protein [Staphylococcus gallinarum]|uniref:YjzD family protein n=1 Tax=Staphylococcus gallinarum TaxID=1293 RepID=UPI001E3A359C|nr:YjzD family protein [Staphylococcus gallinarum]MCD8917984.1 YjzD family protein [Staphylococcus gallinarum]
MKYLAVLFWAILLLEMVNFVLNSLDGGGALNLITPIIAAVVFTILIALFDLVVKPSTKQSKES